MFRSNPDGSNVISGKWRILRFKALEVTDHVTFDSRHSDLRRRRADDGSVTFMATVNAHFRCTVRGRARRITASSLACGV